MNNELTAEIKTHKSTVSSNKLEIVLQPLVTKITYMLYLTYLEDY